MPVANFVKKLRKKMASMQSPRTQCCCCAVGVFAAMFGIFMLSAGICIVLNVNYMEVDTSGLPPDLHNEEGKKIVGIILICVSICCLGLSAGVSILYFAICHRTPRQPHQPHQPSLLPVTASTSSSTTTTSSHHPAQHHHNNLHQHHKHSAKPGSMATPPGSQTSLTPGGKQWRQVPTSSGVIMAPIPSRGHSPSAGAKRRANRKAMHKAKGQRLRGQYQMGLPTHTEEDSDASKSVTDLKHQQRATAETSSSSGGSMAPSQISDVSHQGQYSTTSFINVAKENSSLSVPVITIDPSSDSPVMSPSHDPAEGPVTCDEQQRIPSTPAPDDFTVTHPAAAHTVTRMVPSSPPTHPPSSLYGFPNPAFQGDEEASVETTTVLRLSEDRQPAQSITDDDVSNETLVRTSMSASISTTPAFPSIPLFPHSGSTSGVPLVGSCDHDILQVLPHSWSDIDHDTDDLFPQYLPHTVTAAAATVSSPVPDLAPSSRHHDLYQGHTSPHDITSQPDTEVRTESRSSLHSATSDSSEKDRERIRESYSNILS